MAKRSIRDIDVSGKRVLVRVDFNVPMTADGAVADDRRIRSALPTIRLALDGGAAVILMSHLGRPTGDPASDAKLRMNSVAERLGELLNGPTVLKCDQVSGSRAEAMAKALLPGQVLVLENLRFDPREKKGDEGFARELASLADFYVNDAFGTCHRPHASMLAVAQRFPLANRVVGLLVERELRILDQLLGSPERPLVAVMGGAKVSDKIGFIDALLQRVDKLLVGGAMTYTFRKARGETVGRSLVEADKLDLAADLLRRGVGKIVLPVDHLVADAPDASAETKVVDVEIPDGWYGVDIGPKTRAEYTSILATAKTIVWNGPMGKFEDGRFRAGTLAVAEAMAQSKAVTVVGGGESAEAVERFGMADRLTHVSTGGGAFLEYVEGKPFVPLEVIGNKV